MTTRLGPRASLLALAVASSALAVNLRDLRRSRRALQHSQATVDLLQESNLRFSVMLGWADCDRLPDTVPQHWR
jgi:hypothetical protein